MTAKGVLVLEDGSVFEGESLGAQGEWVGEVVFNTSMSGYQEIITDASYWGQMVVFTCPHIGNVGVNHEDVESRQPYVRAVLARQIAEKPSNWRSERSLPEYLIANGVPALSGIDTRRLTIILRDRGVMRAALSTTGFDTDRLHTMARNAKTMSELAPVREVSSPASEVWLEDVREVWLQGHKADDYGDEPVRVTVLDCGVKRNILRHLTDAGAQVKVVPSDASAEAILADGPDGVLVTNGPGDPEQAPHVVETVRALMGRVPMFGICLGQQVMALAGGAQTYKLPFGHHGANHPVQDLRTGEVEITSQNHNYAVVAESLEGTPFVVTHLNLYDGTIEGLAHTEADMSCVQYHPEASPGPHDSLHLIGEFVSRLRQRRQSVSDQRG